MEEMPREYYWLFIGISFAVFLGILALVFYPIIPLIKFNIKQFYIKLTRDANPVASHLLLAFGYKTGETEQKTVVPPTPTLPTYSEPDNIEQKKPKRQILLEQKEQERKEKERKIQELREQEQIEKERKEQKRKEQQEREYITQLWETAMIAIVTSPQTLHDLYGQIIHTWKCSSYTANIAIHNLKRESIIKADDSSGVYVCAFDTLEEIGRVKLNKPDTLNIDAEELEIKLAIAVEEHSAQLEKLRIERERQDEEYRREQERLRKEKEKNEVKEQIKEKYRRRQLEKLVRQELIDSGELFGEQTKRPRIPREVVDAVYSRDGGRCVYCGSTENLQLDHIIPFSKGGATTLENLQLLCQKCNLEKSNKIG